MNESSNGQFIIEFYALGNSVKVSAFDPVTLTEAIIVGSIHTSKQQLTEVAVKKLCYLLEKGQS